MKKSIIAVIITAFSCSAAQAGSLSEDYSNMKNYLNNNYGLSYNLDYSVLLQRTSPSGKNNAFQSYLAPDIAWTTFNNRYGTGTLNASYTSIFYGNHNADNLANNSGFVTPINDFADNTQEFSALYYTYQLPHQYNWMTFGVGQYSLFDFDGTDYDNNQQVNFLNDSLAQNASAVYASAGLGAYMQATPQNWSFIAGMQDGSNIDATSVSVNTFHDGHYTTFGQVAYTPYINGLGNAQYSFMLYYQPYVEQQPQSNTGWSFNAQQNIGKKLAVFARINGVNGDMAEIKNSYVAGMVYNNPLNRNDLDQIGLAYAYNDICAEAVGEDLANNAEHVIEAYWAWGISKLATLTPDLQFYINPALNQKSDYGTAASLRLSVFF